MKPDERDRIYARAHELRRQGDLEAAIGLFFELLGRNLADREVVRDLAALLAEDDQLDRAQRLFRHALKICGDDPALALNYGTFLAQAGRVAEGRSVLEEQRGLLLLRLADLESSGDSRATQSLREGLAIATLNSARATHELGDPRAARQQAEPYLTDLDFWALADELVTAAGDALGEDELQVARALHAAGRASPLMVWQLAAVVADESGDALAAAQIVLQGSQYLPSSLLAHLTREHERVSEVAEALRTELLRRCARDDDAPARTTLRALTELFAELT